jgi:hypothetical protein
MRPQILGGSADVVEVVLDVELGRVDADHEHALVLVFVGPGADVGQSAEPVDAGWLPLAWLEPAVRWASTTQWRLRIRFCLPSTRPTRDCNRRDHDQRECESPQQRSLTDERGEPR